MTQQITDQLPREIVESISVLEDECYELTLFDDDTIGLHVEDNESIVELELSDEDLERIHQVSGFLLWRRRQQRLEV